MPVSVCVWVVRRAHVFHFVYTTAFGTALDRALAGHLLGHNGISMPARGSVAVGLMVGLLMSDGGDEDWLGRGR